MSSNMTSLESQIASLHGTRSGIAIGNASRGNRDDAIGRGFRHSIDRGHSFDVSAKSKFHRPSVLHDDTRAAADVPLTTLQSNAHDAMSHLASITGNEAFSSHIYIDDILGPQSVTFERGLRTKDENDQLDATLVKMLTLLSTAYGETEATDGDDDGDGDGDDDEALATTASEYSLHVLEYLIRRYDVHVRPATASRLLTSALPQHELPLFRRILQLVDLTNVGGDGQMWTFLRPYAATGRRGGGGGGGGSSSSSTTAAAPPPVPRRIISSRASRDDALLVRLLTLAADVAGVELDRVRRRGVGEGGDEDDVSPSDGGGGAATGCRRGVSPMVSFVAAVTLEALSAQASGGHGRGRGGGVGVVSESTVRSILPHLLTACGGGGGVGAGSGTSPGRRDPNSNPSHLLGVACPDYRNLGYVIAAHLSNLCRLGDGTREVLSVSIARGAAASAAAAGSGSSSPSPSADILEGAADAILAAASVLASSPPASSTKACPEEERLESSPSPSRGRRPANLRHVGQLRSSSTWAGTTMTGCDLLPLSTYLALRRLGGGGRGGGDDSGDDYRFLAAAIGSAHNASPDLVAPLVTSALAWAVSRLSEGGDAGEDSARLICSLTNEPSLAGLWRGDGVERPGGGRRGGGELAGSVASEIVTSFAFASSINDDIDDDEGSSAYEHNCQSCLSALHSSHRTQCEVGIAFGMTTLSKQRKSKSWAAGHERGMKRVAHLLEPIIGAGAVTRGVGHAKEENASATPASNSSSPPRDDDEGETGALLLPPRIALDHPRPSVRIDAIGRLVEQGSRMTMTSEENGSGGRRIDADLIRALLGKIATDDDAGVVVAAVEAFRSLCREEGGEGGISAASPEVPTDDVAMAALAAIRKWGIFSDGARRLLRRSWKRSHHWEKKTKKKSRKKHKKRKSRDDSDADDDDSKEEEEVVRRQRTDEENPYASALRGFTAATCAALALCSTAARMISPPAAGGGMAYDLSVGGGSGNDDDDLFSRLIEAIASHLPNQFFHPDDVSSQVVGWWFRGLDVESSERLTAAARRALCHALIAKSPDDISMSPSSPGDARELLSMGDGVCLALLRKVTTRQRGRTTSPSLPPREEQDDACYTRMERGFLWVVLAACTETLTPQVVEGEARDVTGTAGASSLLSKSSSGGGVLDTVSAALDVALHMLHSYDDAHCRRDAFASEVAALLKCLRACFSPPYVGHVGKGGSVMAGKCVSRLIADLASVRAQSAYHSIGAPAIRDLLAATHAALQSEKSMTQDCGRDDLRLRAPNVLLLEAALVFDSSSTGLGPAPQRIMSLACEEISSPGITTSSDGFSFEHGIIATVVLFSRARGPMSPSLRELSLKYLKFLGSWKKDISASKKDDAKTTAMARVLISAMSSSVLRTKLEIIDDTTTDDILTILLRQAVLESGEDTIDFRRELLNCCVVVTTIPSSKNDERRLVIDGRADGFLAACASVLEAMNDTEKSFYPLVERWDVAGRVLHNAYCDAEAENLVKVGNGEEMLPPSWTNPALKLMNVVVRMLMGVVVVGDETRGVAITTGPTSSGDGGRARSYSVGEQEEGAAAFLDPYPASMADAILKPMSVTSPRGITLQMEGVCGATIHLVVGIPSWAKSVFPKIDDHVRRRMALALITLRAVGGGEAVGSALFGLPLASSDFVYLIRHLDDHVANIVDDESYKLLALTHLADCIRVRAPSFGSEGLTEISTLLFDHLFALSVENGGGGDDGGSDYTRECLLQTILAVYRQCDESATSVPGKKSKRRSARRQRSGSESSGRDDEPLPEIPLVSHARLLLGLLGCPDSKDEAIVTPLVSQKANAVALALLTSLCSLSPKTMMSFLLPALRQVIAPSSLREASVNNSVRDEFSRSTGIAASSPKMAKKALLTIVTTFCSQSRHVELPYEHLLRTFTSCFDGNVSPEIKHELYSSCVDALYTANQTMDVGSAISSLLSFHLALSGFRLWVAPAKSANDDEVSTKDSNYFEGDVAFALQVLTFAEPKDQLRAIFHLHCYAGQLMSVLSAASVPSEAFSEVIASTKSDGASKHQAETEMLVTLNEIIDVAVHGSKGMEAKDLTSPAPSIDSGKISVVERRSLMFAVTGILTVAKEGLTSPAVRKVVRKSEGAEAGVCLRLWKELMQQQLASSRARASIERSNTDFDGLEGNELRTAGDLRFEDKFWEAIPDGIQDCLVRLQELLPAPHFLASVTAQLKDDDVDPTLLRKALRLLCDRAAEVGHGSPESSLFLETVPDVTELLFTPANALLRGSSSHPAKISEQGTAEKSSIRHRVMLQQAGLIAIERLTQSLCLANGKGALRNKEASVCVDALKKVSTFLKEAADQFKVEAETKVENKLSNDNADCQLLSSASLCTASLVSILGARCLSVLPTVMTSLISTISVVNMKQKDEAADGSMDSSDDEILNLVQASILRCLLAVVETIPQFLAPYLGQLLETSALPSSMMREKVLSDATTATVLERLDLSISTNVSPRQMIPAIGAALAKCFEPGCRHFVKEAETLTNILESSIRLSKRAELAPVMSKSFGVLMLVFEHSGHNASEFDLLSASNRGLLALVLKLSETQLRPLYARLRDWRGDLEVSQLQVGTSRRRYVFWSLSATLCKELRGIFLPCLSSVVTDVVEELEYYVSVLCSPSIVKKMKERKKRRKLSAESSSKFAEADLVEHVRPLQPLLLCLELALKADAHEGGGWVRVDDAQRYQMFLSPLSQLLHANVPKGFPIQTDDATNLNATSTYEVLVEGAGTLECGSVSACLTALAAAAGNEQLWKSLNHAVLTACGGESRVEVRKAAVKTLLSVLQTIGEEYMVLLPECLPCLSELLEDGDENISGMARECVRLGEELLGESLYDSIS